jgi:mono/diheme cytochrome c family protein
VTSALVLTAFLLFRPAPGSGPASAELPEVLKGAVLFKEHCTRCHGERAKGDGPAAESLPYAPPDLTRIARRHGGKFPADKVRRIIDGRAAVPGHGGSGMPVWGDVFKTSREGYDERAVREKIDALVRFLKAIQEPPSK